MNIVRALPAQLWNRDGEERRPSCPSDAAIAASGASFWAKNAATNQNSQ